MKVARDTMYIDRQRIDDVLDTSNYIILMISKKVNQIQSQSPFVQVQRNCCGWTCNFVQDKWVLIKSRSHIETLPPICPVLATSTCCVRF